MTPLLAPNIMEEILARAGCLVPKRKAETIVTCHEKSFCDCTTIQLLDQITELTRRLGVAQNTLSWIDAINIAPQESWPSHKVIGEMTSEALLKIREGRI